MVLLYGATVPEIDDVTGKAIDVTGTQSHIAVGVVSKATDLIGQFRQASLMPNIEGGGNNNGDVNYAGGCNSFVFYRMRCRLENLKIIDDYFTKFGYKVIRVKKPNVTTSRFNHFYIKIGQGEKAISGNVPKEGLDVLNKQLSCGITIWKSLTDIGKYEEVSTNELQ